MICLIDTAEPYLLRDDMKNVEVDQIPIRPGSQAEEPHGLKRKHERKESKNPKRITTPLLIVAPKITSRVFASTFDPLRRL